MIRYLFNKNHFEIEDLQQKILNYVGDETFFFHTYQISYNGDFDETAFKIMRVVKGSNSFLPVIKGMIQEDDDNKLYIKITMRPHLLLILFSLFLLILGITEGFKTFFNLNSFVTASAFILFILILYLIEVSKDKKYLDDILGTKNEEYLNIIYDAALEFGSNWRKPLNELALERLTRLGDSEYKTLCNEVERARTDIEKYIADHYDTSIGLTIPQEAMKIWIQDHFLWMDTENITHAISQGLYYAWHG